MDKEIFCHKCLNSIRSKDDLVITSYFFELVPYHLECFSKDLKGPKRFSISSEPINRTNSTLIKLLLLSLGGLLLFIPSMLGWGLIIVFISSLTLLVRLYAWLKIERYLH